MVTRVLLTLDTELVWRHHAAGLGWEENFRRSYEAAGVGVPYQLKLLAEHGLKACFFVDPMPALVHGLEPIRRMVAPILTAGQEVQLHVHPFWARLEEAERIGATPELTTYSLDEQRDLLRRARDLLVEAGAPDPIAFRSGSYAANADTAKALAELGFRYDSSHNGSHHPALSALPLAPTQVAPVEIAPGLIEVPVGQIDGGGLRHLQLCAISSGEMRAALLAAARGGQPTVTIVSHSFELATRNGLAVNKVVQRRFRRLCHFLAASRDRLPTAWFGDLGDLPLGRRDRPASVGTARRVHRMAEQLWGNMRYERVAAQRAARRWQAHVG